MAFQDYFGTPIAYDPTSGELVSDSTFTVHAPDDVALATPLATTDPTSGVAIELKSSNVGVLPDFRVVGDLPQVILKSGTFTTKLTSVFGAVVAAGLGPEIVALAVAAGTVAPEAAAAAEAARDEAVAVGNTNDTIMAAVGANSASSFAKQLAAMYVRTVSPIAYGAAGNDTADDTSAVQSAISAAATFGLTVDLRGLTYKTTDQVNLPSGTILKNGTVHCTGTGKKILAIAGSNVKVSGVTIIGRHLVATASTNEYAIAAIGTMASPLAGITVENCTISRVGMYGVHLAFVNGFTVSNNKISDIGYAGVIGLSVAGGSIDTNDIKNILAGFSGNGYGIALSRAEANSLSTDPRSSNVTVTKNRVADVPWEGIDTHGGENLVISLNQVYHCTVGIAVVGSDNASNVTTWGPKNVEVIGNIIDSQVTDGSLSNGISIAGAQGGTSATSLDAATGKVIGNTIRGHGLQSDSGSGAIRLRDTSGMVVANNVCVETSPNAIVLQNTNFGVVVAGNAVQDIWSSSVSSGAAIHLPGGYNTGIISNNLHRDNGGKSGATYRNSRGYNCPSVVGVDIQAAGNVFGGAAIPVSGVTATKNRPEFQTQFGGAASAPGLAFGTDTATGFYPIGTSDFGLAMAGVRKLRFLATSLTVEDGYNFGFGGTNGTRFGLGATHKLAFWGATPVVQPAAIANSTDSSDAATKLNLVLTALRSVGLIAP